MFTRNVTNFEKRICRNFIIIVSYALHDFTDCFNENELLKKNHEFFHHSITLKLS